MEITDIIQCYNNDILQLIREKKETLTVTEHIKLIHKLRTAISRVHTLPRPNNSISLLLNKTGKT